MNPSSFKPTTDLHYHIDAMSPRAIHVVSQNFGLPWTGKSLPEIMELALFKGNGGWDKWYEVHTRARQAVFCYPDVFGEVARQAIVDAELEGLSTRVMRFSLSMPDFCFQAMYGYKPNLADNKDKKTFLSILKKIIENLGGGIAGVHSVVKTPLVFSISCQDKFLPLLDDLVPLVLDYKNYIAGIDLTNEQTHRLVTDYGDFVAKIRQGGISALTIHIAEKEPEDMLGQYNAGQRIMAALSLSPSSLGHAIYAVKYPSAIKAMAKSGVVVELCPNSNLSSDYVRRGLNGNLLNYPLFRFQRAGIVCTINSDTPATSGTTLLDEFLLIQGIFGLSQPELFLLDKVAQKAAKSIYGV